MDMDVTEISKIIKNQHLMMNKTNISNNISKNSNYEENRKSSNFYDFSGFNSPDNEISQSVQESRKKSLLKTGKNTPVNEDSIFYFPKDEENFVS